MFEKFIDFWRFSFRRGDTPYIRPVFVLVLLSYCTLLVWIDQGTISAIGVQGLGPDPPYYDYGIPGLILDLGLSVSQYSWLGPSFTAGLIVGSLIFSILSNTISEMRLLAVGTLLWGVGSTIAGFSNSFGVMILARILGGIGGGSIFVLSFPYIDDVAPPKYRTLWFGILGICQPVGIAVGYIGFGDMGLQNTWRSAFWLQAGLALPFVITAALVPPIRIQTYVSSEDNELAPHSRAALGTRHAEHAGARCRQQQPGGNVGLSRTSSSPSALLSLPLTIKSDGQPQEESDGDFCSGEVDEQAPAANVVKPEYKPPAAASAGGSTLHLLFPVSQVSECELASAQTNSSFISKLKSWVMWRSQRIFQILSHKAWNYNNLGYLPSEFIFQILSYWAPYVVHELYPGYGAASIDLYVGAIAVVGGIVGCLGGGYLLDYIGPSLQNGFKISCISTLLGCIFLSLAFAFPNIPLLGFILLAGAGDIFISAVNPINYALSMWSVHPSARSLSQALLTFSQRMLGDLTAPPIFGALHASINDWRIVANMCISYLVVGVIFFGVGWWTTGNSPDYRPLYEQQEADALAASTAHHAEPVEVQQDPIPGTEPPVVGTTAV
ncbi:hypothetical protein CEUSTIGMA_g4012.t1 [Chlamydomonas eustigma]|uniref:Major facilitator superfamily (MFS) profile domain-containing protein n=1 Tax=Chlamydomonas eustigma TaxID=1157962 RepID=A0A250X0I6_9CHLO|nr:hypothetical protein CEUSTIGMA_g4012.t1 [Chlamydomonas eustigma]|eukprot:GAX76566.1 hypothetical protein CEUSTIGMA_g4012.t1 [Chlamydomonas eustigma]